jgi:putative membrane protein
MQPDSKKLVRFAISWVNNTIAVMVTVMILHNHITYGDKLENLLLISLLLGILNAFVRPILMILALPFVILTLGLFRFVINALLLSLLTVVLPFFSITSEGHFSFLYAFIGAFLISIFAGALNLLTGNTRVSVQRRGPPDNPGGGSNSGSGGGNGPVIDV